MQVLAEGQCLKHEQYGMGVVTASDPDRTSIDFEDHGTKLFVTSLMKAELVGEAPARAPKTRRRRKPKVLATPRITARKLAARAPGRMGSKRSR